MGFGDILSAAKGGAAAATAKRLALAAWVDVGCIPVQATGCWI